MTPLSDCPQWPSIAKAVILSDRPWRPSIAKDLIKAAQILRGEAHTVAPQDDVRGEANVPAAFVILSEAKDLGTATTRSFGAPPTLDAPQDDGGEARTAAPQEDHA